MLVTSEAEQPVLVTEHTEERILNPKLGVSYKHSFVEGGNLIIDVQGLTIHSRMLHEYAEDGIGEKSRVDGDTYGVKALGMYEQRKGARVWGAGVYNNSSFVRNTYVADTDEKVSINLSETALMGEYADRLGPLGINGNVKATYRHLGQSGRAIDKFFLLPDLAVSYRPTDLWFCATKPRSTTKCHRRLKSATWRSLYKQG